MACDLNVPGLLDLIGLWSEDGSGRLLLGEEKVSVTEPMEKDIKVPF